MNEIYLGDNLEIMIGMKSESIDLIYLDPPFYSQRDFGEFNDKWDSFDTYLSFIVERVEQIYSLLKHTGSMYLHCDSTASHYIKVECDKIFGRENFKNDISWKRAGAGRTGVKKKWAEVQDRILFYTKSSDYYFKRLFTEPNEKQLKTFSLIEKDTKRKFKTSSLGAYTEKSIENLESENLIYVTKGGKKRKKYYLDEAKFSVGTIWDDITWVSSGSSARTGYPTQKPVALISRIINASSNIGDVVLDPFCGSGTTLVSAKQLGRNYIGIDISQTATQIAQERLDEILLLSA